MSYSTRTLGMHVRFVTLAIAALAPIAIAGPAHAQADGGRRTLTIADYAEWRSISGSQISDDGRWVAWSYSRVRGDDTLHVRSLESQAAHVVASASGATFSDDGRWVAYFVSPPFAEAEKLRRKSETVKRQAGLMDLATGETRTWDDADSFAFSEGSSHFFVKKRRSDGDAEHRGTDLILRNLRDGYDELIGSVDQAAFNEEGTHLAFTVDAADKDGNGLYVIDLKTGSRRALDNAKERYSRMTWSEEGHALAVLRGDVPDGKVERDNALYAFTDVTMDHPTHSRFTPADGLSEGWVLSEDGEVRWNEGRNILILGRKRQQDALEDWPDDGLPLADVNIWHWADDRIQAEQQKSAERDRHRTYRRPRTSASGS